jgi:hypothetical protein
MGKGLLRSSYALACSLIYLEESSLLFHIYVPGKQQVKKEFTTRFVIVLLAEERDDWLPLPPRCSCRVCKLRFFSLFTFWKMTMVHINGRQVAYVPTGTSRALYRVLDGPIMQAGKACGTANMEGF